MAVQTPVYVRFPTGFSEITYAADAPKVGDTVRRGADEWVVVDVTTDKNGLSVVTLGPPSGNGETTTS